MNNLKFKSYLTWLKVASFIKHTIALEIEVVKKLKL